MQQRDLELLRGIPGVQSVAATNTLPMTTHGSGVALTLDPEQPSEGVGVASFLSGDSLVDTLGLRLVEGRDFEPGEVHELGGRRGALKAESVILTQHTAARLFPDEPSVTGKIVYLGTGAAAQPLRVVGVVEALMTHMAQTTDDAYLSCILPVRVLGNTATYAVRTEPGERARVMGEAEKSLTALRNDRVLIHHRTMEEIRDRRYRGERSGASMLIAVTIGLLLVTASGIVGVASLRVSQRRKQIGVRRALGARRVDIVRYFLVENLLVTTVGIAIGVPLTVGLNQALVSLVELERLPPQYVIAGMPALWLLGLFAALGPAWRAASVPPAIATRSA
jgi:putative ABC transport system permease protein